MRVLMVQTNTYRMLMPTPLGAALVASRLRADGHVVRLADLMHARDPVAAAANAARDFRPDLACFSIRNRDNMSVRTYHDPIPGVVRTIEAVRDACGAPDLLGGTAFTTFPRRLLELTGARWGIAGDSLDAASRFAASVARGAPDLDTPGLVFRDEGGNTHENAFAISGYSDVAFDCWDLIDLASYRKGPWQAGVVTRSGCPEECVFCDTFHTFGRSIALRDPDRVAFELLALKRTGGVRSAFLVDAGFNRPLAHAKDVLRAIIRRGAQMRLCAIHDPGPCDEEYLALYSRAGGAGLVLFAESLSDAVLRAARKPFGADEVRHDAAAMRRAGVPFMFMPTLGGPGETRGSARETLDGAFGLGALYTELSYGWRIQPRTALRERAVAEGVLGAGDDCWEPRFYFSPETPRPWLEEQVRRCRPRQAWAMARALPTLVRMGLARPWLRGPEPVA